MAELEDLSLILFKRLEHLKSLKAISSRLDDFSRIYIAAQVDELRCTLRIITDMLAFGEIIDEK